MKMRLSNECDPQLIKIVGQISKLVIIMQWRQISIPTMLRKILREESI